MSEENKQGLDGFNDEVGSVRDEQAQGIENSASNAAHKTIDQTKKITEKARSQQAQALRKQLGIDNKLSSMKQKAGQKAGGVAKKGAKKAGQVAGKAAKAGAKMAAKAVAGAATKLAGAAMGVGLPYILGFAGAVIVVSGVSYAAAIIIDNESSRTNEANYQHQDAGSVNRVSSNGVDLTDDGNVFYNPKTKRYEMGKGRLPTQSNRLYYVYYAVMSQQSRWFVEFERTDVTPDTPGAGSDDKPYWKKIKRTGDVEKYTLDGYLFNQNVLDKVNLRPITPGKPLTLENLIDEKAAESIHKLSLDTNLLYLLNSTLNGELLGTGKTELFFAEQFVKPTYHDDVKYDFKNLTKVRDYTEDEKKKYQAQAHGDSEDGELEKEFQKKYDTWTNTLETQNEARGGTSTAGSKSKSGSAGGGDVGSAEGINNEILKKAVEWGLQQVGKGITYSMNDRNGPNSYDCSSFITRALTQAGMEGVDGLSTVGMLAQSNALGNSGTKFKEVDYKTAKKGTIIVVGGMGGAGANGHTFFLLEDFHGDQTKVLDCSSFSNGPSNQNIFLYQSMNYNQVVALEPVGSASGGGSSSSSSSSLGGGSTKSHNTSGNYSTATKNKYKDKASTAELEAKSRIFDTNYRPEIAKDLYKNEDINQKIWDAGDYYISSKEGPISSIPSEIDVQAYNKATKNSQFEIGKGPTMDPKTNKAKANSQDDAVLSSTYWAERDEITQWSFENGYNPAFIISLIKVLTDDGNKELSGSKYNFLNDQSIVKLKDAQNGDSGSSSGSKPEEKKEEKKADNPDSANKDAEKDPVDDTSWKEYGASYYNYTINITNIQQGLEALDRKLSENNDSKEWNLEQAKKLGLKDEQFERINDWYKKSGGQGSTHAVFANQELKKVKVHTYNGKGPEDTDALGVISIKGKVDETEIDGYKKYKKVNQWIKQADAVVKDTGTGEHPYAIKRKSGSDELETKEGVWDYGFGSIFKIAKLTYEAYEVGMDEHGNYYLAQNEDTSNWLKFIFNKEVTSDTQYQILGATTPFGSIDVSEEIVKSQWEIEKVIEKLKRKEELSGADVAILEKHKEGTSMKVNGKIITAGANNFFVSTKPILEKDPEVQNINGAQYIFDYLINYETYVPSSTQARLNVVDRWKAMNDANASTQEATDKINDIFNKLIGDGKNLKDSKGSSSSSSGGASGTGEGGLDTSPEAVKARKQAYDALIQGGMGSIGAIGMITNWVAESNVDPTTTFGEYVSKYVVSEQDKNTAYNTDKPIGVAQWLGGRKQGLLEYAKQKGKEWSDMDLQIDYLLHGESDQIRAVLPMVAQSKDVTQAASRFFMGWEIHGGGASLADNDPYSDPLAVANNIEGHISKATSDALWKELVTPNGEVKADLSKLSNGSSTLANASGGGSDNSSGTLSNWGDGTGFAAIVSNFLADIRDTVVGLFGGNDNWDPTMFATKPTENEKAVSVRKDGKTEKTYNPGDLYINGADAYTWTYYEKKLDTENARMLVRQFVASTESRENRPVYYDEIFDNWNDYELGRILEENYKHAFKDLFKTKAPENKGRKADIASSPFKGSALKDMKILAGYGWMKQGDKVVLNPGYKFKAEPGTEVTAVKSGRVVFAGNDKKTGNTVIIRSTGNSEQIAYTGLGSINGVKVGDNINVGDVIGKAGSDGEIGFYGIYGRTDVSDGMPEFPVELENNSVYFDIGINLGLNEAGRKKILKEVNGYDPDKNTINKPKAANMTPKEGTLGDYISDGGGDGVGVNGSKDITPVYGGDNTYPHGECTWGAKALAPWAGNYWGNGGDWAASARAEGYKVDQTPEVGAIASWNDGGYGHVAVVTAVNGYQIQVKESNYNGNRFIGNHRGGFFDPRYSQGTVSYIHPK